MTGRDRGKGGGNTALPANRTGERGGCLLRLMFLGVIVGAALSLAWMALLPIAFTRAVRARTGFEVEVASLSANPFTGRVTLRGLVITNPPTYPVRDFFQLRAFEAEVAVWSLYSDRVVIEQLTLDIRQLTLVKRANGSTNAATFRTNLACAEPTPPAAKSPVVIRRLHLRFDTLVLADYTEAKPRVRTYALGLDQQFNQVSTLGELFVPSVLRGLGERDVVGDLMAFLPADLRALLDDTARTGERRRKTTERKGDGPVRGFLDKLEEMRKP